MEEENELLRCPNCNEKQYGWTIIATLIRTKMVMLCRVCGYKGIEEDD